ncbi:MAG: hypothetical protein LHW56_03305 [Candidatus Cloacimonetes bacterium]|jgi:hypothetical protein|nr:hypothetical protein [Candidatus Cloacimonadota bacterium]MDY0171918.1 hypothetical protein [Candidatus Cloacimonadaceae bacterium]
MNKQNKKGRCIISKTYSKRGIYVVSFKAELREPKQDRDCQDTLSGEPRYTYPDHSVPYLQANTIKSPVGTKFQIETQ